MRGDTIKKGDVFLSNHPQAGGSHLPDLTVITPVFYPGVDRPVFFVASRGHHADIGGTTPGKMHLLISYPQNRATISHIFYSFKWISNEK